jgi:hypothetical protein
MRMGNCPRLCKLIWQSTQVGNFLRVIVDPRPSSIQPNVRECFAFEGLAVHVGG